MNKMMKNLRFPLFLFLFCTCPIIFYLLFFVSMRVMQQIGRHSAPVCSVFVLWLALFWDFTSVLVTTLKRLNFMQNFLSSHFYIMVIKIFDSFVQLFGIFIVVFFIIFSAIVLILLTFILGPVEAIAEVVGSFMSPMVVTLES